MRKITHRNHICILPLKKELQSVWVANWICHLCFRRWEYEKPQGWKMEPYGKKLRITNPWAWNRHVMITQVNALNEDPNAFSDFVMGESFFGVFAAPA